MTRYQRAQQIWSLLVCAARERRIYSYIAIARILGFGGAGVMSGMLAPIMWYCIARDLRPLTLLVVNEQTGRPGDGLLLDNDDIDAERERIFAFDWFSVEPPGVEDFQAASEEYER